MWLSKESTIYRKMNGQIKCLLEITAILQLTSLKLLEIETWLWVRVRRVPLLECSLLRQVLEIDSLL